MIFHISPNGHDRDARAMYYCIMIDPQGKNMVRSRTLHRSLMQHEPNANNAQLQKGKKERERPSLGN